jgi:hypothetical protein
MHTKRASLFGIIFLTILISGTVFSQQDFGSRCIGNWKGIMHIYSQGLLVDSVPATLDVQQENDTLFTWKIGYLSEKSPLIKDYALIYKGENHYQIDEGNGIKIDAYLFVNRLVSVFETEGILLTSTYEVRENELYFEVTSGTKEKSDAQVQSYRVGFLQNIRFKKD